MLKQGNRAIMALALAIAAASASAAPPAGFEQRVEQLRKEFGVPGVSIAIVEDGTVTLAHGWGVRDITTNQPVDADTIFFTGSTGKAYAPAASVTTFRRPSDTRAPGIPGSPGSRRPLASRSS